MEEKIQVTFLNILFCIKYLKHNPFLGLWTKLMVVGGQPSSGDSEIYDLSGQNTNCPIINNFPYNYGSFGIFINNKSLVCGGRDPFTSECYSYKMEVSSTYT